MNTLLLAVALVVAALIVVGMYRAWRATSVFNRLLAISYVTVNGVLVLVLTAFLLGPPAFFLDIAIAYSLFAFILPVAIGRFFQQPENRPRTDDEEPPP